MRAKALRFAGRGKTARRSLAASPGHWTFDLAARFVWRCAGLFVGRRLFKRPHARPVDVCGPARRFFGRFLGPTVLAS